MWQHKTATCMPCKASRMHSTTLHLYPLLLTIPFTSPNSQLPNPNFISMAEIRDRPQPHQLQVHSQAPPRYDKAALYPHKAKSQGPSAGQILAIVTLLPIGGSLLGLAGIILAGTLIALAVATPLFVIFSPVLVPAVILVAGAVTGILTSGAFGLTGLSSLSWVVNLFRQATGGFDQAKRRMQETAREAGEAIGEKTKKTGEEAQRMTWR